MIKSLLAVLTGTELVPREDTELAHRIAIAAILVEAARADDEYLDAERAMIDAILAERFDLDPEGAADLRRQGEEAHVDAVDLVRFTRAIKEAVPHDDRVDVIEAVWRVIYADDARDPDESALVRRLCGLLYVSDRDAGLARQKVAN